MVLKLGCRKYQKLSGEIYQRIFIISEGKFITEFLFSIRMYQPKHAEHVSSNGESYRSQYQPLLKSSRCSTTEKQR